MKVFSNKKTTALFILTIMLVISLISLSVAWFHRLLTKDGFDLQTGDIVLSFNAYEYENSKLTELASGGLDTTERDSETPTVTENSKLLLTGETKYADISETGKSYYLKIERGTDSIDVDYTLSFMLEGKSVAVPVDSDVTNDLAYLGGFEFRIVKITPKADAVAPSQEGLTETEKLLAFYCVQNHVNDATITSAYSSLSVVETHIHEGSINENNTVDFYRLDIRRVPTTQNVADYAGRKIQLRAELNATQDGAYQGTQHYVSNTNELDSVLEIYAPGDTIHIMKGFTYTKDLVFNRPVNLYLDGQTLKVFGNVVFSFNTKVEISSGSSVVMNETCTLNTTSGGRLIVCAVGISGGNFTVNTPASEFVFKGTNSQTIGGGDIYVQNDLMLTASYEKGIVIDGARIYSTDVNGEIPTTVNNFKTIRIGNGTHVTVNSGSEIGDLKASTQGVYLMSVLNNGIINDVNFANMYQDETIVNMPQIYLYNNGQINKMPVTLASWSKRFYPSLPDNNGNTRVIQGYAGNNMTVTEYNFKNTDIEVIAPDQLVTKVNGDPTNLLVYYTDTSERTYTLQSLLTEFYESSDGGDSSANKVVSLQIRTSGSKVISQEDYNYLRSNYPNLEDLDMTESSTYVQKDLTVNLNNSGSHSVTGNYAVVPTDALRGLSNLKNVNLPGNTQVIMNNALAGTAVEEIYLPNTLLYFERVLNSNHQYALHGIKYVHITTESQVVGGWSSNEIGWDQLYTKTSTGRLFVPASMVEAYRTNTTYEWYNNASINRRIIAEATRDESGNYFIRQLGANEYEIAAYVGGQESNRIPADNVYKQGSGGTGLPLRITSIGEYAYAGVITDGTANIFFDENIRSIGANAFYQFNAQSIDFTTGTGAITSIGANAFRRDAHNDSGLALQSLDLNGVQTLGDRAFYGQNALMGTVSSDTLQYVDSYAFAYCQLITDLRLTALTTTGAYAFGWMQGLVVCYAPNWTATADSPFYTNNNASKLALVVSGRFTTFGHTVGSHAIGRTGNRYAMLVMDNNTAINSENDQYQSYAQEGSMRVAVNNVTQAYYNTVSAGDKMYNFGDYTVDQLYLSNGTPLREATSADFAEDYLYLVAVDTAKNCSMVVGNFFYSLQTDSRAYSMPTSVTIDETEYAFTELGKNLFYYNREVFDVDTFIMPETVEVIGRQAFRECRFAYANIPESILSIDDYAFYAVDFTPVVRDNDGIYQQNSNLNLYNCTHVGANVFQGNDMFTSVVGNSVLEVGNNAFYGTTQLEYVRMDSVKSIGTHSFSAYTYPKASISTVIMPNLTSLGSYAFHVQPVRLAVVGAINNNYNTGIDNNGGQTATIVNTATNVSGAINFVGETETNRTILTRSAHEIGYLNGSGINANVRIIADDYDFADLYYEDGRLVWDTTTGDTIGKFLIAINRNDHTAQIITTLDNRYDNYDMPSFVEVDGEQYNVTSIAENAWRYHGTFNADNVILPTELTTLNAYTFAGKSGIAQITLNDKLTYVGNRAFYQTGINGELDLNNVTFVGERAFAECAGITAVYAPKLTTAGVCAFGNNANLQFISLPEVTSVGDSCFAVCSKLDFVYLPKLTYLGALAFNSDNIRLAVLGVVTNSITHYYPDYTIINSTATSGATMEINNANYGTYAIMSEAVATETYPGTLFSDERIVAPKITADGMYFGNGIALKDARLGDVTDVLYHVNTDGTATFVTTMSRIVNFDTDQVFEAEVFKANNSAIEGGFSSHTITHIADYAFYYGKDGVTSTLPIYLPSQLQVIGNHSFHVANNVTATYAEMVFPYTLESIGYMAFDGEMLGGSITITGTAENPARLVSIGDYAFSNSGQKTSVTIESSELTSIGISAFNNCDATGDYVIASAKLATVHSNAFRDISCANFTLAGATNGVMVGTDGAHCYNMQTEVISIWGFDTIESHSAFAHTSAKAIYLYDVKSIPQNSTFYNSQLEFIYAPNVTTLGSHAHQSCPKMKLAVYGAFTTFSSNYFTNDTPLDFIVVINDETGLNTTLNAVGAIGRRTVMNQATVDRYASSVIASATNRIVTGEHTFSDYYLSNGVKLADATYQMLNIPGISIVALDSASQGTYEFVTPILRTLSLDDQGNYVLPTVTVDGVDYVASVLSENSFRQTIGNVIEFKGTDAVTLVRQNAFYSNANLIIDKLYLDSAEEIQLSAFYSTKIGQVFLRNTTNLVLADQAFYDNDNLTAVHLGENTNVSVGTQCFYGCNALAVFDTSKANSFGDAAFRGTILTSVRLNDSITAINFELFRDTKLTEIIAPGVVTVGDYGLYGIEELRYVYMPSLEEMAPESLRLATAVDVAVFGELRIIGTNALHSTSFGIIIINTDGIADEGKTYAIADNIFSANTPCVISTAGAEGIYNGVLSKNKFPVDNLNISTLHFDNSVDLANATYATLGKYLLNAESDHAVLLTSITSQVDFQANQMPDVIVVPDGDTTKDLTVTHIYQHAFAKRTITAGVNVVLPNGLTHVGDDAFDTDKMVQVASITFPTTLVEVGNESFRYISSLADVTLDCPHLVSVGERAFSTTFAGTGTFNANLPSLLSVGTNAFYGIKANVINFTANSEAVFGNTVFSTSSAKEIYLTGAKDLGYNTFINSANLHTVHAPDVMYGSYMFSGCGALAYVYVPNRTSMLQNEFNGIKNGAVVVTGRPSELPNTADLTTGNPGANVLIVLTDLTAGIAEGATVNQFAGRMVMSEATDAMYASTQLSNQRIPLSRGTDVTTLYLYNGTTAVRLDQATGLDVTTNSALLQVVEEGKYNYVSHVYQQLVYDGVDATYTLPEVTIGGVDYYATEIAPYAFRHVKGNFGTLDVGEHMETIGHHAFYDRGTNLTFVTLNLRNTQTVGDYAFYKSAQLSTIMSTSATGVTFGEMSFYDSNMLKTISLVGGVINFGKNSFAHCGILENYTTTSDQAEIHAGPYAFNDSVKFGVGIDFTKVVEINERSFRNCDGITYVHLLDSITTIPDYCFSNADGIDVFIAEGVTEVKAYGMYDIGGLTTLAVVYMPNATVFRDRAFEYADVKLYVFGNSMVSETNAFNYHYAKKSTILLNEQVPQQSKSNLGNSHASAIMVLPQSLVDDGTTHKIGQYLINSGTHVIEDYVTQGGLYLYEITNSTQLDTLCALNADGTFDIIHHISADPFNSVSSYYTIRAEEYSPVGSMTVGNVEYTLKNIGAKAYYYTDIVVTSLTMPSTLQSIGDQAFYAPNNVEYEKHLGALDLANVANVGKQAFYAHSSSYATITGVTSTAQDLAIGDNAFYNQNQLTQFTATGNVTFGSQALRYTGITTVSIGGDATFGNSVLRAMPITTITVGGDLAIVGSDAIRECKSLTTVTVGGNVTEVGVRAFYGCQNLVSFPFEKITAETIQTSAFQNCDTITSVTLGVGVKYLEDSSFYDMDNVAYFRGDGVKRIIGSAIRKNSAHVVYLPQLVEAYQDGIFYDMPNLELVVIGEMTTFTNGAFSGNDGTTIIVINGESTPLSASEALGNGALGTLPATYRVLQPSDYPLNTAGRYMFDIGSTTLEELRVLMEDGTTQALDQVKVWTNAKGIIKVYNQDGKNLYDFIVYAQSELKYESFTLPNVTIDGTTYQPASIGDHAFYWRTSGKLGVVTLPESVTRWGDNVLGASVTLSELHFDGLNYIGLNAFNSKSISVIDGSTTGDLVVADYAFNATASESFNFPFENVTSVGESAFYQCKGITSVKLSDKATSIPTNAFREIPTLVSFEAQGVEIVYVHAFYNDTALVKLVLPSLRETIGNYPFYNCDSLEYVEFGAVEKFGSAYPFNGSNATFDMNVLYLYTQQLTTGIKVNVAMMSVNDNSMLITVDENRGMFSDNENRIIYLPANYSWSDVRTYGTRTVNGVTMPAYYYLSTDDGLHLVYCALPELTGEQLSADLVDLATYNATTYNEPGKVVTIIGNKAYGTTYVSGDLTMPDGVVRIESEALDLHKGYTFNRFNQITNFNTNQVQFIGAEAFNYTQIDNIVLGESIQTLEAQAINYNVKTVGGSLAKIPQSVTLLATNTNVTVGAENFGATTDLYVSMLVFEHYNNQAFGRIPKNTAQSFDSSYEDDNGVTFYYQITSQEADSGYVKITAIAIRGAFNGTLTIPTSITVTNEGGTTFTYYVDAIDSKAFAPILTNEAVKTIVLPDLLKADAFQLAPTDIPVGVEEFAVNATCQNFSVDSEGVLYNKDGSQLLLYPIGKTDVTYALPAGMTSVNLSAFAGNPYLQQIIYTPVA